MGIITIDYALLKLSPIQISRFIAPKSKTSSQMYLKCLLNEKNNNTSARYETSIIRHTVFKMHEYMCV